MSAFTNLAAVRYAALSSGVARFREFLRRRRSARLSMSFVSGGVTAERVVGCDAGIGSSPSLMRLPGVIAGRSFHDDTDRSTCQQSGQDTCLALPDACL
jgi:hypothetical protein